MSDSTERPPSKINGKANPAYTRWYRQQPSGVEALARYNASEKALACRDKYKPKAKNSRQKRTSAKRTLGRIVGSSTEKRIASMLKEGWKVSTIVVTLGVPQSIVEKVAARPK